MASADPLSVPCGVCGAAVREPCQSPGGRVQAKPHAVRASAAKRKAKGEGSPHSRPSWLDGKV